MATNFLSLDTGGYSGAAGQANVGLHLVCYYMFLLNAGKPAVPGRQCKLPIASNVHRL